MDKNKEEDLLHVLQEAVLTLESTRSELKKLKEQQSEPIAIIGMGCRFPGDANNPEKFWELLEKGFDGISPIPKERWNIDDYYDANPDAPAKMYTRFGGFLTVPIDQFDAQFFGISPREVEFMDPQQRLMLEVSWEALENAFINPQSLFGSKVGVFMGVCLQDYREIFLKSGSPEDISAYFGTGNVHSILTGRLSYLLGLQGPSLAVDTACSSSLVALHSACQSLHTGDSNLALAGGVSLILNPDWMINFCKSHMLAPDGHCKTFDAKADGYARGEGCGIVVLKRLSDALKDKDPILAVIRATDVNQDGASSGLTVPNRHAQASLILSALKKAGREAKDIDYIEAHGTGTSLGDPIEAGAIADVFSGKREKPLLLGSVKTNIGHLEGAAGVAGLIKVILSLQHASLPPHLHFEELNPGINLNDIPAQITSSLTPWQKGTHPRLAGISSFGFSGTNAHVIIEEAPSIEKEKNVKERPLHLLTLSAKTQAALNQLVELYKTQLPNEEMADIAFTVNTGRAHFNHRIIVVCQTREELFQHLQASDYLSGETSEKPPKIVFFFSGNSMESRELLETSPVFKEAFERSQGLFEYAFFELIKSWGIIPDYIAGERQEGLTADYWKAYETIQNIPEDAIVMRSQNNWKDLLQTLAHLYLNGFPIDFKAFDRPYYRKKITLPTYPFQRERYWIKAQALKKKPRFSKEVHPLLGELITSSSEDKLFKNEMDLDFLPYLKDHVIYDSIILPGAAFVELLHGAGKKIFETDNFTINNILFEQPLGLDIKNPKQIELLAKQNDSGEYTASISSQEDQYWVTHVHGDLLNVAPPSIPKMNWQQLQELCQKSIDTDSLYELLDSRGYHYGKEFQTIRKIWTGNNEFIAELDGGASPTLIDGSLHALTAIVAGEEGCAYLPFSMEKVFCFSELGNAIRIHGKVTQISGNSFTSDVDIFSYDGTPHLMIQNFRTQKTTPAKIQQMLQKQIKHKEADWFYEISWQTKSLEGSNVQLLESWIIVSQKEEIIEGLKSKSVKPEQAIEEFEKCPTKGVVWFASSEDSLKDALYFVQALSKLETKPKLYFITRGIQPIGPILDLSNTTFNGFFRTLILEISALNCRHIDIPSEEKLPLEELMASDKEEQVAYRKNIRYVPRLIRKKLKEDEKEFTIDPSCSYLITGGFGGMGRRVAHWLAEKGAKHLVLVGRKIDSDFSIPNVTIAKVAMDIGDKPGVQALIQKFGNEWPELKGIIHAAGIAGGENPISSQRWEQFEKTFASKIQGSWNLHESSLTKPLDFFVLFSSLSSVLGLPRSSDYTSANAYLEALSNFRRQIGLPSLAISWGFWADVGMAAQIEGSKAGQKSIKPDEGVKALELALQQNDPHVVIADMDWNYYPYQQVFLNRLITVKTQEKSILLQRLSEARPSERKEILNKYLQQTVGKILGLSALDPNKAFFEAGMDSLMSIELRNHLQSGLGKEFTLPISVVFDHSTISKMGKFILSLVFPATESKEVDKTHLEEKKLDNLKQQVYEPIAIIGMSCRFPGGANDPDSFWKLLAQGRDGIVETPEERWDSNFFYDPNPEAPGKMYTKWGGFLNVPVDQFDANFFRISPREAEYMDPQQRLLLEVSWEALENAAINPLSLKNSLTGVFIGVINWDYGQLLAQYSFENYNAYMTTGIAYSALAARVSYFLGLQGPSMTIDTACSSSLVTLHNAFKGLQNQECDLALAGGVNLMLFPGTFINYCKSHMLAKDGYCKTFDADADGYSRGEGCGILVLKRLSDAIQNNDPILAVIRSATTNHNGDSSGLTVPNGVAQTALIRRALKNAELESHAVDYIEAHGTGTSLGDPIEMDALASVFKGKREQPLYVGSVKTNVGHLEGGAGVAGVIKTVLALNHEAIPPHIHYKQVNPHISLDAIPAKIPLTLTPWPRSNRRRIAGVSSFGMGGTNAHAIIEEPPFLETKKNPIDRPWHILTLSAKTQAALDQLIDLYKRQLPEVDFADIAYTANTGRAHFAHRAAVLAQTKEEFLDHLKTESFLIGQMPANLPKIAFIFTGEKRENSEFMETSSVFKEAMERSQGLYEYALFELWKSWGITPDYVAGEGIGDIIAACAAGIITLEEGLKLIAVRNNGSELEKVAKEIQYNEPQIEFLSSWTGQVIQGESMTAAYWKPHDSKRSLPEGCLIIEPQDSWKDLLQSLAELYLKGFPISWEKFDKPYNRKKVILPNYPFQRERYWFENQASKQTVVETSSWFYQISWQPKEVEKIKEEQKGSWWIVSEDTQDIEGLDAKRLKPEQAVSEKGENIAEHVLWFVRGQNSLKYILEFVQALEKLEKKPQLFFITQGIQPIGPMTDLDNATFNGFFKTLKLEMPSLNTRHIDLALNEKWPPEELLADDSEDQVAYRQGIRYVPRFVYEKEIAKQVEKTLEIDPKGSYLITGGLGALGLLCAKWLVEKGAKHLVLIGRRASPSIEIPGAIVETAPLDVSDRVAVEALIQNFGKNWPELKGVIHTAGVLDDGILSSQNWSRFEKVFAPKVQGSWNLHESTLNKPLDFFILFSSVASSLGSPGQINYSSANSYMDALAYYRHDKGLPALSISWGPWSEVGLAAKLTERHRSSGFIAIKPKEGVKAFELALKQASPHVSIVNADWKLVPFRQTFLSELVGVKGVEAAILLQRLSDALPSERKDILTDYLQKTVGKILGIKELNPEQGFFEAGIDSLMTKELQAKLQADIGDLHTFPSTLAFDYPSISKLSQYFEEKVFPLIGIKTAVIPKSAPIKESIESADQIAIIGLSCRFPGGANNPQAFWECLKQGYDGISEIPADRWDIEAFYDPQPDTPGKMYVRRGGFLNVRPDTFDADFFGISPEKRSIWIPNNGLFWKSHGRLWKTRALIPYL